MQEQGCEQNQSADAGVCGARQLNVVPFIRSSMRGLKRCPNCGALNGQRSRFCTNKTCEPWKQLLLSRRPFDPVQLVCRQEGVSLYSVRCKEHNTQPRNFVQLADDRLTAGSQETVCYSCGRIGSSSDGVCKHVKACTAQRVGAAEGENVSAAVNVPAKHALPQAEVYTVAREVLWNLIGIGGEQKQRLWSMCEEDEALVPAVQRINAVLFVVKCSPSKVFPAGRLHVTAVSNGLSAKKGTHSCACKKLKIIVEPDNSVVMQEEVCDHILLVLAAILSKKGAKMTYGNFTDALKSFWMPAALEAPIVDSTQEDALFGLSIDIGGNFGQGGNDEQADDIFIYDNDFLTSDDIPDFSDIILDTDGPAVHTHAVNNISRPVASITNSTDLFLGYPSVVVGNMAENNGGDGAREFQSITSPGTGAATHLVELSDCNIELMDQFQLTDQIDLCSDDITLLPDSTEQLFDNGICGMSPVSSVTGADQLTSQAADIMFGTGTSPLKVNQAVENLSPLPPPPTSLSSAMLPPPIEMPTIAVVKKCPVRASEIVAEVKTRKFPHLPAKRSLIVNTNSAAVKEGEDSAVQHLMDAPSLAYSAWLDYVIETMNESIAVVDKTDITHCFHVHEEMFAHFSKSFSAGVKRRIPNYSIIVKSGRHKGLIKYTWFFSTASTVRRIFSTQNISLETERMFECSDDGTFVPYVKRTHIDVIKHKRIYPKLALYTAHIWFDIGSSAHKNGLKLEWLPNAFPKSHFGILTIEFSLGIRDPHNL